MSADIFNAWEVLAASTVATIITGGVAVAWAQGRLSLAQQYWAAGEAEFDKAEQLQAEVERTRNLPWYWPTGPAIKAAPAEHEGEVLHVEHTTAELRQLITQLDATNDDAMDALPARCCDGHDGDEPCDPAAYALPCCGDCPDWAARTRALSDQPHHDDEDAPSDDTDRPRWWATVVAFVVLAPLAFARRQLPVLAEWLAYRLKSQAQRDAEFAETYHRALEQARDEYAGRRRCEEEAPVNPSYKSRHVHPDFQTGAYQVINPSIPSPREAAE